MTTETLASLAASVIEILNDGEDDFTAEQVVPYVKEGIREMWKVRPASRYVDGVLSEQSIASSVEYDERWRLGIVYFAAARACELGIKDSVHLQLAQTLKQQAAAVFAA